MIALRDFDPTHARQAAGSIPARALPQYSRSRLQDWIEQGRVLVNGSPAKRSYLLKGAERIQVPPAELAPLRAAPEDLPLEVLYEDADVIAINKPAGMVVHAGRRPALGNAGQRAAASLRKAFGRGRRSAARHRASAGPLHQRRDPGGARPTPRTAIWPRSFPAARSKRSTSLWCTGA